MLELYDDRLDEGMKDYTKQMKATLSSVKKLAKHKKSDIKKIMSELGINSKTIGKKGLLSSVKSKATKFVNSLDVDESKKQKVLAQINKINESNEIDLERIDEGFWSTMKKSFVGNSAKDKIDNLKALFGLTTFAASVLGYAGAIGVSAYGKVLEILGSWGVITNSAGGAEQLINGIAVGNLASVLAVVALVLSLTTLAIFKNA